MSAIPNRQADDITALLEQDRQARDHAEALISR
jgi:1-deoxy-D-xylulose-5-phosphate reductoisomerase